MKDAMKFDRLLKETLEDIHDDHLSGNINTPLREDAFELSDKEKINKSSKTLDVFWKPLVWI